MYIDAKFRVLNGYIAVYLPNFSGSYNSHNWKGWIYEHIFVSRNVLKRSIEKGEDVHHLDFNKVNNCPENLIVLSVLSHRKLHAWVEKTGLSIERVSLEGKSTEDILSLIKRCKVCSYPLKKEAVTYCSRECLSIGFKRVDRPSRQDLLKLLEDNSFLAVGRMFGVSDNAIRKWLR